MMKRLNSWDMSKKVHISECKTYIRVLHVGTNDLNSSQTSGVIGKQRSLTLQLY